MSVRTKARHTRRRTISGRMRVKKPKPDRAVPWRRAYKFELAKYSEGGLMLRGSRSKEEISQADLAKAVGVSQHHISEMENGKRSIGKEMAKRFADFFKIDYRVFL